MAEPFLFLRALKLFRRCVSDTFLQSAQVPLIVVLLLCAVTHFDGTVDDFFLYGDNKKFNAAASLPVR